MRPDEGSDGNQVNLGEAMIASALELRHESFHLRTPSRVEVKWTLQDSRAGRGWSLENRVCGDPNDRAYQLSHSTNRKTFLLDRSPCGRIAWHLPSGSFGSCLGEARDGRVHNSRGELPAFAYEP